MLFRLLRRLFETRGGEPAKPGVGPFSGQPAAPLGPEPLLARARQALAQADLDLAEQTLRQALSMAPANVDAMVSLAYVLVQKSMPQAAIEILERLGPGARELPDAMFLLGSAYRDSHRIDQAKASWQSLKTMHPDFEHVYGEYALLLFQAGMPEEAELTIREGVARHPERVDFQLYLGNMLLSRGDFFSAEKAYRHALAIDAHEPAALTGLGNALRHLGQLAEAVEVTRTAHLMAPADPALFSNFLFTIQYSPEFTDAQRFLEHKRFGQRFEPDLAVDRALPRGFERTPNKLKIGYVSGDFRMHSLAFFIEPVLRHHDKTRFEIYGYHAHPHSDLTTQRLARYVDHWVPCAAWSDGQLAARIREDGIHVLIDLSGHTGFNRLLTFARKPAPVQATWLGYQATTGLTSMDYRLTDEVLDPPGKTEDLYTETLFRMATSGAFEAPSDSPPVNALPALSTKAGPRRFVFACLNNPAKITPEALALWAQVLQRVPHASLLIGNATEALQLDLTTRLQDLGVGHERLLFQPKLPLNDYLALHHQVDLALDTFPYNGGTTSFYSLWMGVPVIALQGDTAVSRVGTTLLCELGLDAFCAATPQEYVEKAVAFSSALDELGEIRRGVRGRMQSSAGLHAQRVTAEVERFCEVSWAAFLRSA